MRSAEDTKHITTDKLEQHPQYTPGDYEYLSEEKQWTDQEILDRWNEEYLKYKDPVQNNKYKITWPKLFNFPGHE